ncbi:MAG: hypothetical protein IKY26_07515 [Erysipelotrichaceae bacterium]|nr:hypothetical protein [Erysipelotrichaceae bacterium]
MKILFWLLAIGLIPVNLFLTFFFVLSGAVGGYSGTFGTIYDVLGVMGHATIVIGIIGIILGIIAYKKENFKKAIVLAIMGTIYGLVLVGSMLVLDSVHTGVSNTEYDNELVEIFGENWDSSSNYSELCDSHERLLNMVYVAVKEEWSPDELNQSGELWGIGTIVTAYGDNSLENLGFAAMDLNNDNVDELVIGTTNANEATKVFVIYYEPENLSPLLSGVEENTYYLHDAGNGLYNVEVVGVKDEGAPLNIYWELVQSSTEGSVDFNCIEETLDPANRLTLPLISFADYK